MTQSDQTSCDRPVGYILTHFPKLAQTFIADEIEAVEKAGGSIRVFAMNAPEDIERSRDGAKQKIARTVYLKTSFLAAFTSLVLATFRHPLGMARIWVKAFRSASLNPAGILRRLSHLTQAALVARDAAEADIHHLHAHFGLAPATIAWFATEIAKVHGRQDARFSFTIHGFHDFVDPNEARLDLKAAEASRVLCISDFTKSQLCLTTDPSLWHKFHVARCGIDLEEFAFRPPPAPGSPPRVMALGRLSPEKGFSVLIEAVAQLHAAGRNICLSLVGDGPSRGMLEEQVQSLGLSSVVTLEGELPPDRVRKRLAASDVFCMSSFSEGLPISIMEAMAIGVPVVSTWISGIPELAQNETTALTVPPADPGAIAEAIARLLDDDPLRHRLSLQARDLVAANHDLSIRGLELRRLFASFDDTDT